MKKRLTATECEVDPRDIEDMLCGRPRRRPRPPINVNHHKLSDEQYQKFLERIGQRPPSDKE